MKTQTANQMWARKTSIRDTNFWKIQIPHGVSHLLHCTKSSSAGITRTYTFVSYCLHFCPANKYIVTIIISIFPAINSTYLSEAFFVPIGIIKSPSIWHTLLFAPNRTALYPTTIYMTTRYCSFLKSKERFSYLELRWNSSSRFQSPTS